jgi:hypothetical protein
MAVEMPFGEARAPQMADLSRSHTNFLRYWVCWKAELCLEANARKRSHE